MATNSNNDAVRDARGPVTDTAAGARFEGRYRLTTDTVQAGTDLSNEIKLSEYLDKHIEFRYLGQSDEWYYDVRDLVVVE